MIESKNLSDSQGPQDTAVQLRSSTEILKEARTTGTASQRHFQLTCRSVAIGKLYIKIDKIYQRTTIHRRRTNR